MREAPWVVIAELLMEAGVHVRAYDPVAMEEAKCLLGDRITDSNSDTEAVRGADALSLITEWAEFRVPSWEKVGIELRQKVIFYGRNFNRREVVAEAGLTYEVLVT